MLPASDTIQHGPFSFLQCQFTGSLAGASFGTVPVKRQVILPAVRTTQQAPGHAAAMLRRNRAAIAPRQYSRKYSGKYREDASSN